MKIPSRNLGNWAQELVDQCTASRKERIQRGAVYKNIFLTGDPDGNPQTYPKTFAYIDNLASYIYSPVECRWAIQQDGQADRLTRAKAAAASSVLNRYIRRGNLDTKIEDAVTWSLVKGKCFIKLLWQGGSLLPYVVQPELMGVEREDRDSLDDQEFFVHSTYITIDDFGRLVTGHPKEKELRRKVVQYLNPVKPDDSLEEANQLKQIILGGLNPYQQGGQGQSRNKGQVNWMDGPKPVFDAKVLAKIVRFDELWVRDKEFDDDWSTIQLVGPDCVIEGGGDVRRNLYNTTKGNPKVRDPDSPLHGKHPFYDVCPNRMDGYFWGRSEILNVQLLQTSINKRVDGINMILRRQEEPPRVFTGGSNINQVAVSRLNKPGGWLADSGPTLKVETLAPAVPADMWQSLHELEQMFNEMAGFQPVLQGRGESGVRAQGHAETLTRNATPRFKDRALLVERDIEAIGGGALDLMKAQYDKKLIAYVPESAAGLEGGLQPSDPVSQPPAPNMKEITFLLSQLDDDMRVVIDSHSSSPAFVGETRSLIFDLAKAGALSPEYLIKHAGIPDADSALSDFELKEFEQAKLLQEHPELAGKLGGKKK